MRDYPVAAAMLVALVSGCGTSADAVDPGEPRGGNDPCRDGGEGRAHCEDGGQAIADSGSLDGRTADAGSADAGIPGESGGAGFSWDQTHVDTSWLFEADASGTLTVEKVTTLEATGTGSLADALAAAESNASTLVVFEVGGVIDNGGETYIRSYADNVYIAGQTAPYPGVTLIRGGLRIHGDNTIVAHMTFLPGDHVSEPHKSRAITFSGGSNVLVDHCTAGWAPDTNVDIHAGSTNVAFINSINAEALNDSSHPEAPHGYGTLITEQVTNLALMGNLRAHNWKRNPYCNYDSSNFVYVNNYTYNWGARVFHGNQSAGPEIDMIGNAIEAGADTDPGAGVFDDSAPTVFYDDNLPIPADTPLNDGNVTYAASPMNLPTGLSLADIVPAADLQSFLVSSVGPRPADRAPHERRLIDDFVNRTGRIIDHQRDVGGYPSYASTTRALEPPSTSLLEWLRQYTDEVELGE